jgi:S-adenosylmethionine:tRNA ribosyltransferase-isomerase
MTRLADYDYDLPEELIAQRPLAQRADARLMIVQRATGEIEHSHVRDLSLWLEAADCLVLNDSRVLPARLVGHRLISGGRWQGLFLSADEQGNWQLLCKTRGKLQPGELIVLTDRSARDDVRLRMLTRLAEGTWAARPETSESTWELLERIGRVPLPEYIRGGRMIDDDLRWYQTVYASHPGSVAAPTAGLHLTEKLLRQLSEQGVMLTRTTLHVGMGTFRPIKTDQVEAHRMHSESGHVSEEAAQRIQKARERGGRVVAVGTSTVRILETAAATGTLAAWAGQTDLFIRPPYRFRIVDALMTNFHLPRSTLLVLIRTLGGDQLMRRAYEEAIRERYRFYSYGDAMLIT